MLMQRPQRPMQCTVRTIPHTCGCKCAGVRAPALVCRGQWCQQINGQHTILFCGRVLQMAFERWLFLLIVGFSVSGCLGNHSRRLAPAVCPLACRQHATLAPPPPPPLEPPGSVQGSRGGCLHPQGSVSPDFGTLHQIFPFLLLRSSFWFVQVSPDPVKPKPEFVCIAPRVIFHKFPLHCQHCGQLRLSSTACGCGLGHGVASRGSDNDLWADFRVGHCCRVVNGRCLVSCQGPVLHNLRQGFADTGPGFPLDAFDLRPARACA